MPCNTIQTNTVDLEKVSNHDLLEAAVKNIDPRATRSGERITFHKDGYRVVLQNGRATSEMPERRLQETVSEVKKHYSSEAVRLAAKRFGWTVEKGLDAFNFHIRKQ